MENCNCRAITSIEYTLSQIGSFYEDLVELDEYKSIFLDYDEDHKELLDDCDRLRAKFAGLYEKS